MMRILSGIFIAASLAACSGGYGDLEQSFSVAKPAASTPSALAPEKPIAVEKVILVSTKGGGADNFNNVLAIKLTANAVEIEPKLPLSLWMNNLSIPAEAISGCSKTCFGTGVWDADILVERTGVELSFPSSDQIVEWCWANKIPMIPAKARRQWLYANASLPSRSEFSEQLSSRERFDQQARQSCLGY